MSDFPPGSSAAANAKSPAYADALLRARQVRTSIRYIISIFLDNDFDPELCLVFAAQT